jgi:hypothetical protein
MSLRTVIQPHSIIFSCSLLAILLMASPHSYGAENDDIAGFMVVDCLLPGQVRRLGNMTYSAARKAVRTTASDCEIRGGEYIAYDRATRDSSIKVWKPLALEGDAKAQHVCGEIFEKGMGEAPDYSKAANWYIQAAEQGYAPSAMNLGNMFEQGLGFEKDMAMAQFWYRKATGIEGLSFPTPEPETAASSTETPTQSENILIVEPPLKTRDGKLFLSEKKRDTSFPLVGQINTSKEVRLVVVDGNEADIIGNSLFRSQVNPGSKDKIDIAIIYKDGQSEGLTIQLKDRLTTEIKPFKKSENLIALKNTTKIPSLKGRQHALIIGNEAYDYLTDLDTASNDAQAIADILEHEYGFDVTLINDANRYKALSAINDLRLNFKENDRLLVYYAGHGELDRVNKRGHWLPVDAEQNNPANWISTITITDLLNTIPAQQMIVIADSCYSGMMTRSALGVIDEKLSDNQRQKLLKALTGTRTRTVLTSGGVAPVLDGGAGGNSVFAGSLLEVLKKNQGAITGFELYNAVAHLVEQRAGKIGFLQKPEYAPLQFAGHEAGDFVLIKQ